MWPERRRGRVRLYICGFWWPAPGKLFAEWTMEEVREMWVGTEGRRGPAVWRGGEVGPMGICYPDLELRGQVWAGEWYGGYLIGPWYGRVTPGRPKIERGPRIAADPWEKQQPEG